VDKIESMGRKSLFLSGKSYLLSQLIRVRAYLFSDMYWPAKFSVAGIVCPVHHNKSAQFIKKTRKVID